MMRFQFAQKKVCMQSSLNIPKPLQSIFWSENNEVIRKIALILAGVLILAASAQLVIPLTPIPLTFQSATVILLAMAYGPRLGTYAVIAYLALGIGGLPIFESFSFGLAKLTGPTAGYLLGF